MLVTFLRNICMISYANLFDVQYFVNSNNNMIDRIRVIFFLFHKRPLIWHIHMMTMLCYYINKENTFTTRSLLDPNCTINLNYHVNDLNGIVTNRYSNLPLYLKISTFTMWHDLYLIPWDLSLSCPIISCQLILRVTLRRQNKTKTPIVGRIHVLPWHSPSPVW